MRTGRTVALCFGLSLLACGGAADAAEPPANPAFEKLKTLVGTWETKTPHGRSTVSYEVVSAGSALLERIGGDEHKDMDMVTMYHPDGGKVLMTHYCSAKNQPRMKAENAGKDASTITFSFVDVTNLSAPDAGHMAGLVVKFEDKDHFTQEWTWKDKSGEKVEVFRWTRTK